MVISQTGQGADTMKAIASRWIPQDAEVIENTRANAVAYLYADHRGRPCVIAYQGRRKKADMHVGCPSAAYREQRVSEWFGRLEGYAQQREAEREARKHFVCDIPVGTMFYRTWGYEQTNVDFYEVVALRGKRTVMLRPIVADTIECGSMSGTATPVAGKFKGEAFAARASSANEIRIDGRKAVQVWAGRPITCSWYG
jgi:hypothetical protein